MRRIFISLCTLSLLSLGTQARAAEPDPFTLTQMPILTINHKKNIRVAYDIKDDVWEAGIGKGLYYVRGLLEAYKSQGIP